ncbi:mechanosensitive ion channel [Candidatus Nitrosopumilus sp. SW]|uniref:mechanosensitive ion channel domain-containing protein n=1 Tax=Candidatus Nitrosopumilus sp. SW TaxID=2508726 RepID=UPI0011545D43|nr:mechanosensitive ion channel domain-containing protein [Candidatus Nitrosopumilus sp. SW]QDI89231.1 mechanosensitive ion channel [Candidatus Nitrosopumilus sp. SW]
MTELFFAVLSLAITAILYLVTRQIINKKLQDLQGSDKLLGMILLFITFGELFYLGTFFGLFDIALEMITSIGAAAVVIGIALQNQLKNAIAGISIFLNPQINVGDTIEFDYVRCKITGLHLTKTTAVTEEGVRVIIPNHKFSEEMIQIYPKTSKIQNKKQS